jgi:hypothetical protein
MSTKRAPGPEAGVPAKRRAQEEMTAHAIVNKNELPHGGSAHRFEGYRHGGADVPERTRGHRRVPLYAFGTVQVLQKG